MSCDLELSLSSDYDQDIEFFRNEDSYSDIRRFEESRQPE